MLIDRTNDLEQIESMDGTGRIRVLYGLRQSGKTTLLDTYRSRLIEKGVCADQILMVDLDNPSRFDLKIHENLYAYLLKKISRSEKTWVLIDEIQACEGFEQVLSSLLPFDNLEIVVAGSNARVFPGAGTDAFVGRIVRIPVYPFSFSQFLQMKPGQAQTRLDEYLQYGGLPGAAH